MTITQTTMKLTDEITNQLTDIRGCNDSGYEYDYHSHYLAKYNGHWWLIEPSTEGYFKAGDVAILYPYRVDKVERKSDSIAKILADHFLESAKKKRLQG